MQSKLQSLDIKKRILSLWYAKYCNLFLLETMACRPRSWEVPLWVMHVSSSCIVVTFTVEFGSCTFSGDTTSST
jgi:hypothetical protein